MNKNFIDWCDVNNDMKIIIINLENFTNDILDTLEIIEDERLINYIYKIKGKNETLDIDKIIDKLINIKYLIIETHQKLHISRLPSKLKDLTEEYGNNDISIFPETLERYYIKGDNISIPVNLPQKDIDIQICGIYSDNIFENISSHVTTLSCGFNNAECYIKVWPHNIKKLILYMTSDNNLDDKFNYGILPYGLEEFYLRCYKYTYPIILPPTIKKLNIKFYDNNKYKYSNNFTYNNIEVLHINYKDFPNISILPEKCKLFVYMKCPNEILTNLQSRYPNCKITNYYIPFF